MKTTLDLPNALVREIKLRAVNDGRKLKDTIADLLKKGLRADKPARGGAASTCEAATRPMPSYGKANSRSRGVHIARSRNGMAS